MGSNLDRLSIALLENALSAILRVAAGRERPHIINQNQLDAMEWIASDEFHWDEENGISFRGVCYILGVDHTLLRERIYSDPKGMRGKLKSPKWNKHLPPIRFLFVDQPQSS